MSELGVLFASCKGGQDKQVLQDKLYKDEEYIKG